RDPGRGARRRPPVHGGPARPGPGDPHLGGAAAGRLPAVAERPLGVLLLRCLLAGLPAGGLPPGAAVLRRAASPVRRLSAPGRWVLPGFHPGLYRRNWMGGA